MTGIRFSAIIVFILSVLVIPARLTAQTNEPAPVPTPPENTGRFSVESTIVTLNILLESTQSLRQEIAEKEKELKHAATQEAKLRLVEELKQLKEKLEEVEKDFSRIATGVDLESMESGQSETFEWKKEVQDLLGPVIRELKNMTARPRQIEKLRSEAAFYEQLIETTDRAVANLRKLTTEKTRPELRRELTALAEEWEEKRQEMINQLKVVSYQLEEKSREKRSIIESTQTIVRTFFKSRGRNMLLSLFAFLAVFFLLRFGHRLIHKYSPVHKSGKRTFYIRLGDILYTIFIFVGATGAMLVTLYISGDWVLLSIAIIFILGIIWTAKQGLPKFWEQAKLLLNLGAVRENERLIYMGVPWRVVTIDFYCHLENPELRVGRIRLPLRALTDLISRPVCEDEPWFPSRVNDWVVLSDDTFGKVVMQSPELVQLILRGGDRKQYPTPDYLALSPRNLSAGFRLGVVFGVDYGHQAIVTQQIPEKLRNMLETRLEGEGYGSHIKDLRVEFREAGPSSLDLEILTDFSGSAAQYYLRLRRILQRISVDACNAHGWTIPFTQITLHNAYDPTRSGEFRVES